MKRVNYDNKPLEIEAVGNGSYRYRWDIQEEQVEIQEGDETTPIVATKYSCYEVVVWGPLTSNKITEVAINALWGDGIESKLINDFNAASLGLLGSEAESSYKEFIQAREGLKTEIASACIRNGIENNTVTLEDAISTKITEIEVYDKSSEVDSFIVDGEVIWLDKQTRSSLYYSTTIKKGNGEEYTTLYFGNKAYPLPIDSLLQMLAVIELYADACYKTTQQHIIAVSELKTIQEVEDYDITENYPDRLIFSL